MHKTNPKGGRCPAALFSGMTALFNKAAYNAAAVMIGGLILAGAPAAAVAQTSPPASAQTTPTVQDLLALLRGSSIDDSYDAIQNYAHSLTGDRTPETASALMTLLEAVSPYTRDNSQTQAQRLSALKLAARLINARVAAAPQEHRALIQDHIIPLLADPDASVRNQASLTWANVVARAGNADNTRLIINDMADRALQLDVAIRGYICQTLLRIGFDRGYLDEDRARVIWQELARSPDRRRGSWADREWLAENMFVYAPENLSATARMAGLDILQGLMDIPDKDLIRAAAKGLLAGMQNDPVHDDRAVHVLRRFALVADNDELYSVHAHMGRIGRDNPNYAREAALFFVDQAKNAPHTGLRLQAPLYLESIIENHKAILPLVRDFIRDMAADKSTDMRILIADITLSVLRDDPSYGDEGFGILAGFLQDSAPSVRYNALGAVGEAAVDLPPYADRALTLLLAQPLDQPSYINNRIIESIAMIGARDNKNHRQQVLTLLDDLRHDMTRPEDTRVAIVTGYGLIAESGVENARLVLPVLVDHLAKNADDPTDVPVAIIRTMLAIATAHEGMAEDIAIIIDPLRQHPQENIRVMADTAIKNIEIILQRDIDRRHMLVRAAIEQNLPAALTDMDKGRDVLTQAIALTKASDAPGRRRAVEIIGQIGRSHSPLAAPAFAPLPALAADPDTGVRTAVVQAATIIALRQSDIAARALPVLGGMAGDSDNMVGSLAVNAIGALAGQYRPLRDPARALLEDAARRQSEVIRTHSEKHLKRLVPAP